MKHHRLWFLLGILCANLALGYALYDRGRRGSTEEVIIAKRHLRAGAELFRYIGCEPLPADRMETLLHGGLIASVYTDGSSDTTVLKDVETGATLWQGDIGGRAGQVVGYHDSVLTWIAQSKLYQGRSGGASPSHLLSGVVVAGDTQHGTPLVLQYDTLSRTVHFGVYAPEEKGLVDTFALDMGGHYNALSEYQLAYDGLFTRTSEHTIYTPFFFPRVLLFDSCGRSLGAISTIDQIPAPVIAYHDGLFVYKRGSAFRTNLAAQILGEKLYVLPYRVNRLNTQFILDVYSLPEGRYEYSVALDAPERRGERLEIMEVFFSQTQLCIEDTKGRRFTYQIVEPVA